MSLAAIPAATATVFRSRAKRLAGQMAAIAVRRKQKGRGPERRRFGFQQRAIGGYGFFRVRRQRHDPFASALAFDGDEGIARPRRAFRQRHQFADAQPGGVERLQQRIHARGAHALAQRTRLVVQPFPRNAQQPIDLGDRQHARRVPHAARPFEGGGGIVDAVAVDIEEFMELTQRRNAPGQRGARHAARLERGEIVAQTVGRG